MNKMADEISQDIAALWDNISNEESWYRAMQVAGLIKAFKRACAPGGHYLDYYAGTPSYCLKSLQLT